MHKSSTFLRNALKANALFSFVSGLVFGIFHETVGTYLGIEPFILIQFVGLGLVGFSLCVWFVATRKVLTHRIVWLIITLDILWVITTAYSMISGIFTYTNLGIWVMAVLALIVLDFAIAQYVGLRKLSLPTTRHSE